MGLYQTENLLPSKKKPLAKLKDILYRMTDFYMPYIKGLITKMHKSLQNLAKKKLLKWTEDIKHFPKDSQSADLKILSY